ncbi:MAG: hypothetical protein H7326_06325, partial [Bdellovibrionaceae bacterium]|nr:hypothetical protein [Pseudobdellovibrionaceae bacterium]
KITPPTNHLVNAFRKKLTIARAPFFLGLHKSFNDLVRMTRLREDFFDGENDLFNYYAMDF